jgi:hypothetical protein
MSRKESTLKLESSKCIIRESEISSIPFNSKDKYSTRNMICGVDLLFMIRHEVNKKEGAQLGDKQQPWPPVDCKVA